MDFLKIFFPVLMVIGAAGSLVVSVITKDMIGVKIQWFGAMCLYFGLTLRNMS